MSSLRTCAECTTPYALDLAVCPHCGSSSFIGEGGVVAKRLPLFTTVSCPGCGRGPFTVRLHPVLTGLVELPTLACASCGSRVPVTWPPKEEPMSPKITVHGGPTNAREADVSPVADVSQPQDVAEDVLGRPTSADQAPVAEEREAAVGEALPELPAEAYAEDAQPLADAEPEPDYDGMTLAELREAASARDLPSYGNKAAVIERLREADQDVASEDGAE